MTGDEKRMMIPTFPLIPVAVFIYTLYSNSSHGSNATPNTCFLLVKVSSHSQLVLPCPCCTGICYCVCVCVCTVTVCCGYVLLWGCTGFQYCQFHDQIKLPLFEVSGMPESALLWSGLRLAWPEVVYSRNVWV